MMVVTHVPTKWWSDINMMSRVKKIDQKDPSALNKVGKIGLGLTSSLLYSSRSN